MAVIIPLVMYAAGAELTTIAITSLALTAVGANAAINKAASSVFGKDLVSFANIAGGVFLATSGSGMWDSPSSVSDVSGMGIDQMGASTMTPQAIEAAAASGAGGGAAAVPAGGALATAAGDIPTAGFENLPTNPSGISPAQQQYGAVENGAATSGPATGPATAGTAPAGAPPKPFADAVWDKVTGAWKSLGDKGQGALLQVGGNLLAGAANSANQAKMAADQRAYDSKYRSGSGLTQWAPKRSVYSPGGAP